MSNQIQRNNKIAKLIYQSTHRGCKENDIILGRILDFIESFNDREIDIYERFLSENDDDIYSWASGRIQAPFEYNFIIHKLKTNN